MLFECWTTEGTTVPVLNRLCLLHAEIWKTRSKLFLKHFSEGKKRKKKINIFVTVSDSSAVLACKKWNRSHPKHRSHFRSSQTHATLHHLLHCSDTPNPNWNNRFNSSWKLNEFAIENPDWKEIYSSGIHIPQQNSF